MYREKQKYHKVRTNQNTKTAYQHHRMQMKKIKISEWWSNRYKNRRIYSDEYEQIARKDIDYVGPLPWPDTASFRSMYEDFMISEGKGMDISSGEFCVHMHQITKIPAGTVVKRMRVEDWNWIKSCTHLDLPR